MTEFWLFWPVVLAQGQEEWLESEGEMWDRTRNSGRINSGALQGSVVEQQPDWPCTWCNLSFLWKNGFLWEAGRALATALLAAPVLYLPGDCSSVGNTSSDLLSIGASDCSPTSLVFRGRFLVLLPCAFSLQILPCLAWQTCSEFESTSDGVTWGGRTAQEKWSTAYHSPQNQGGSVVPRAEEFRKPDSFCICASQWMPPVLVEMRQCAQNIQRRQKDWTDLQKDRHGDTLTHILESRESCLPGTRNEIKL